MSTTVIYNNITLRNVLTRRFDQTCEYDDSHTDLLFHKFTVSVRGYVHGYATPINNMGITPINQLGVAESEVAIRQALAEPRREFKMLVGESILLHVRAAHDPGTSYPAQSVPNPRTIADGTWLADLNNGPKPTSVTVTNIVGSSLMVVEFTLELHCLDCPSANANQSGVLNNRWSVRDTIDESWLTTRTVTGRLRVTNPVMNPQSFRGWVVPPLQAGFIRQSIDIATTTDGLTLEYTVTDRETVASPPDPAIKWTGQHAAISEDGSSVFEEFQITVWGDKYTPKLELIRVAALVSEQRLGLQKGKSVNTVQQASIISYLDENKIDMRLRTIRGSLDGKNDNVAALGFPTERLASLKTGVPDYKPDTNPAMPAYGTATITGLFVSYLQSPCNQNHWMAKVTDKPSKESKAVKGEGTKVTVYDGKAEPAKDVTINFEAKENRYEFYELSTSIVTRHQTVQVPVSGRPASTAEAKKTRTSRFVVLAPATQVRTIKIVAERYGEWPKMPPATNIFAANRHIRLIGESEIVAHSTYSADKKTRRYHLEVEYTHGIDRPYQLEEKIAIGKLPWETASIDSLAIKPDTFDKKLAF
jgi:hypothetical protein